jgi:putative SOS response-associated peptidase YedK
MCGRYLFKQNDDEELNDWIHKLNLENPSELSLKEVFPSQKTIVLIGPDTPAVMRWGLKKWDDKGLIINARSESVKESPFFREHLSLRRCIIKAEAFFEWNKDKQKNIVSGPQQKPFYMAGVYDDSTETPTFAILTDEAEGEFRKLHNRVPLFIPEVYLQRYIDDGAALLEDFRNLKQFDLTWKNQETQISLFE